MLNLVKIQIIKYKSIENQVINLNNISRIIPVVGENNAGKTNTLETIELLNKFKEYRNNFLTSNIFNDKKISFFDTLSNSGYFFNKNSIPKDTNIIYSFNINAFNTKKTINLQYKDNTFYIQIPNFIKNFTILVKTAEDQISTILKRQELSGTSSLTERLSIWIKMLRENQNINFEEFTKFSYLQKNMESKININKEIEFIIENIDNLIYLDKQATSEIFEIFETLQKTLKSIFLDTIDKWTLPKIYYISEFNFFERSNFEVIANINLNDKQIEKNLLWDFFSYTDAKKAIEFIEKEIGNIDINLKEINLELMQNYLFELPEIKHEKIYFVISKNENNYSINFKFLSNNETRNFIIMQSPGSRKKFILSLFIRFASSIKSEDEFIFIFDEPDLYLHIDSQTDLLLKFIEMVKLNKKIKLIYSTHSIFMLNYSVIYSSLVISKNDNNLTEIRNVTSTENKISKMFNGTFLMLFNSIAAKATLFSFQYKRILLVEGKFDYIYLNYLGV